jgi:hypothetical protein
MTTTQLLLRKLIREQLEVLFYESKDKNTDPPEPPDNEAPPPQLPVKVPTTPQPPAPAAASVPLKIIPPKNRKVDMSGRSAMATGESPYFQYATTGTEIYRRPLSNAGWDDYGGWRWESPDTPDARTALGQTQGVNFYSPDDEY